MADDSVARPARRIIKIKFGNTVVATQAVRVTGLVGSASQDSKDVKSGSAIRLAKLRQASLKGYVLPNASADAIVARLREGEGFAPGSELPPWDFMAPATRDSDERPSKRLKQSVFANGGCLEPSGCTPGAETAVVTTRSEVQASVSRRCEPAADTKIVTVKAQPAAAGPSAAVAGSGGESNSDQATNSQAYLPLSPDDVADASGRAAVGSALQAHNVSSGGQSSLASSIQETAFRQQRPRPPASSASLAAASSSVAEVAIHVSRDRGSMPPAVAHNAALRTNTTCSPSAARTDGQPSISGRQQRPTSPAPAAPRAPSGVSVETQTSQRDFPVLPTSFLELARLSGTALSYKSIGPFDLQLEQDRPAVSREGQALALVDEARRVKKEGDALFQRNGKAWTIKSLSKYLSASLVFMEAAEAMLRERSSQRHVKSAQLYRQTADLLSYTVNLTDSIMRNNGLGKEVLRLLAERLCAVCLLRQATLLASNFKACAEKAQAALREHQRQQAVQGQGAGGSAGGGPQPSPEDSSTSSLHPAHSGAAAAASGALTQAGGRAGAASGAAPAAHGAGGGAAQQSLAGFGPEQVAELIDYARTTCRFAEQMKRSNKSFEAFLERADVRQDQQAKMVCVHLAAIYMDMGMAPGMRVVHHAREAVRTLCEDLAR